MPAELPAIKNVCFASRGSNLTIFRLMKFWRAAAWTPRTATAPGLRVTLKQFVGFAKKEESRRVINNSIAGYCTYKSIYGYQMRLRR